jgi:hypothetical protein
MKKLAMVLMLAVLPLNAYAVFECDAQVTQVLVYGDGSVGVLHTARNDIVFICNVQNARLGVGVATCSMWTSMLIKIKENGGTANFYYDGTGSCGTLPTYTNSPAPVYIGDVNPN